VANNAAAWIGGNDKTLEGTFVWPSGIEFYKNNAKVSGTYSKLSTTAFNTNSQDTQDCVTLKDTTGELDDILCSKAQDYICEKAAYAGAATFMPTTVPVAACSGTCAAGWTPIDCNCYKFQATAKTWQLATDDCTLIGTTLSKTARLVSLTSRTLEIQLLSLSGDSEFWTGGNDKTVQKTFVWDLDGTVFHKDGNNMAYHNWWSTAVVAQPNHVAGQDCIKLKVKIKNSAVEKFGWDDISCDASTLNYICQYSIA